MPEIHMPRTIEGLPVHRAKLEALALATRGDPAFVGMTIKGSFALDIADEFSDLDLSFVIHDDSLEDAQDRRMELVESPGMPVAAFTGEHVGLSELLIVLYDDLVHADFLYVALSDFPGDNEPPCHVIWERDGLLSGRLATAPPACPRSDVAWLEARIWTWIWYTQAKILRGEVYEALDALQFIRSSVLFPLLAATRRQRPAGSRRAEQMLGEMRNDFEATVPASDRASAMEALEKTAELYLRLADPLLEEQGAEKAEMARRIALAALRQGLSFRS